VRDLQQVLSLRPYEARRRVALLRRFHEATPQAEDALLKTLEEPTSNTVLLLTADSADAYCDDVRAAIDPLRPLPVETSAPR